MTIEEQTAIAAMKFCKGWGESRFIEGAQWERQRDKWINVKDELPQQGAYVLTWTRALHPCVRPGSLHGNHWMDDNGESIPNVTHFQPLPEPPKE